MNLPKLLILASVLLVIAATDSLAAPCPELFADRTAALCRQPSLPNEVIARAADYISSNTSPSYQGAHYSILAKHCYTEREDTCDGAAIGYRLLFLYAPFRDADSGTAEVHVYVPAEESCPPTGDVALRNADGVLIDPKIPRDEALRIAHSQGAELPTDWHASATLSFLPRRSQSVWRWLVGFESPGVGQTCWQMRHVEIDAVSGSLINSSDSSLCE